MQQVPLKLVQEVSEHQQGLERLMQRVWKVQDEQQEGQKRQEDVGFLVESKDPLLLGLLVLVLLLLQLQLQDEVLQRQKMQWIRFSLLFEGRRHNEEREKSQTREEGDDNFFFFFSVLTLDGLGLLLEEASVTHPHGIRTV